MPRSPDARFAPCMPTMADYPMRMFVERAWALNLACWDCGHEAMIWPEGQPYNLAFKLPGEQYSTYCTAFLSSTAMGGSGSWDGSGVLLEMHNSTKPRVFKFALCVHEKTEDGHSPNHGRGWHPGHCKHCGLDMTVDSGD